jgi:hypothetical protein
MAYIGPEPNPGQNREVDDISSGFNGSEVNFTLQVNSQNVSPGSPNNIIVSLGGVVQNPSTDYNIAASTITFTTAPASGLSFFGLVLGQQVDIQSLADGTSPTMSAPSITGDLSIADKIVHTGDTNNAIRFPAADTIAAETGGSERLRVDSSGRLLIGTTSGTSHAVSDSNNPLLQVESSSSNDYGRASFIYNGADGVGPGIYFGKSRGTSDGSNTVVADGDQVGGLFFQAADGTDKASRAASIICNIDGTPGSNDTPARLVFSTSGDGASATTERMRIDSSGNVGIGTTSPNALLDLAVGPSTPSVLRLTSNNTGSGNGDRGRIEVFSATSSGTAFESGNIEIDRDSGTAEVGKIRFRTNGGSGATERMRIDSVGNIGAPSGSNIFNASDSRVKKNVVDLDKGLSAIKSLRPVSFNWIDGFCDDEKNTIYGFLAQEVQTVDSNLIENFANDILVNENKIENVLRVNEKFLIPMLVKALQEAVAKIETLETKVAALEAA